MALAVLSLYQPAAADEPKYARMPWHLVDTWWDLGGETPFQSLEIDVEIEGTIPADVNLYVSPVGLAQLNKSDFYGGVQTNCDGNTRKDPHLRPLGPGFLMSMWGERSLDAIRPSVGGYLQSSGHEGDFVSVRRPFAWKPGSFTYRVVRMDEQTIDGKPHTWVGAFVHVKASDENVFIGALRFPGSNLVLGRKVANFVEIYGRTRPAADIPTATIRFGTPRVNGRAPEGVSASATYPKGVPDYADVTAKDGTLVVTLAKLAEPRTKRQVKVIARQSDR